MNVFTNTKTTKRILIILVALILFNFCCPKNVKAIDDGIDVDERIVVIVESLFFWIFDGLQSLLNDFFIDDSLYTLASGVNTSNARVTPLGGKEAITVSAETIIKGKFLLIDPNIFKRIDDTDENRYLDYKDVKSERNMLRDTIASWYYAIRDIAIVSLLSILLYVSIRMILTTISQDKAKYKVMFKDWLVALCLVFVVHYMMVGILNVTDIITESIGTSGASYTTNIRDSIQSKLDYANNMLAGSLETGIMDQMKQALQETVIYAAMFIMNIIFVVKYTIRALTLIFLALLGPVSCITYPIDKISDGKAQAFDMWFKEYLYNVIIQPFHLLIYVVLIGAAASLAAENLIYAMVCFGVMIPAEKFIKQMFGFKDKLSSPLGAFAGGAVANQLMNSMRSAVGKGASGGGGKDSGSNKPDNLPPPTKEVNLPGSDEDGNDKAVTGKSDEPADDSGSQAEPPVPVAAGGADSNGPGDGPVSSSETGDGPGDGEADGAAAKDGTGDGEADGAAAKDGTGDGEADRAAAKDGTGDGEADGAAAKDGTGSNRLKKGFDKLNGSKAAKAAKARFSRNIMRKYGSTNAKTVAGRMAQRGLKRVYRGAKNTGKRAIKGAATLVAGLGLGAFGAMFGKGKEFMAVGAGIGNKIGTGITNKTDKLAEKTEGYAGEMWNAYKDRAERKDKREFKENEKNIQQARLNYRERHGKDPIGKELDNELEKMYMMDSHGIKPEQYNDVLRDYANYVDTDGDYKYSEEEAMDTAMTSALMAQNYSPKDLMDSKPVQAIYDEYMKRYKEAGVNPEVADKKVRELINGAGRMKGVKNVPLPAKQEVNQTVDIPVNREIPELASSLGIHESRLAEDPTRTERIANLRVRLLETGFTPAQINQIAQSSADSEKNADDVINTFEDKVNAAIVYVEDDNARHEASKLVRALNEGTVAPKEQVDEEMRDRFVLKSTFNVERESDVSAIRAAEEETFKAKEKTQKQAARDFARENKVALESGNMEVARKQLRDQLKAGNKNASDYKLDKDVENIVKLAEIYTKEK